MGSARVQEIDRCHEVPGQPPIQAERHLQVLRKLEVGIKEADPWSRATPRCAGCGLVHWIKWRRHHWPVTEDNGLVPAFAKGVSQPAVGWRAAEETDAAAEQRRAIAAQIVMDA